ncbi:hypothetical protein [Roseococcus sp. YIM B11640]|uniref:hypothetical protein n=1 Tax=Roseococcus sp. YIM B11640 TaxID=3133973 RepID=UPI003C7DABAA
MSSTNDLKDELVVLRSRIEAVEQQVPNVLWQMADCASEAVRDTADAVHAKSREFYDYVDRHPLKSLGFAAAAGFVLAQCMRR